MADNPAIEKIVRRVPTLETTNLDEMKVHVRYLAEHLDQLLDFNKCQHNPRFQRQLLEKIGEIANCLAVAGKNTVVFMGDYDNDNRDGRLKGGSSSGPV
ncbi:hypothetical protein H632_c877p1 [Helicosporidium sp. ATCC 50920]|nr:hypothetical protein H632_c877p1 [Helicosporidium sp. ATCC 50920]|eukprot:KDD75091.1 hypothetical protein H632_c877p1 [Helicosporidium sp. ATCC 50920]